MFKIFPPFFQALLPLNHPSLFSKRPTVEPQKLDKWNTKFVLILLTVCQLLISHVALATNYTFIGGGGTTVWTTAANWTPSYPGTNIPAGHTVTIASFCQIQGGIQVINSSPLTINSGVILGLYNNGTNYTQQSGTMTINGKLYSQVQLSITIASGAQVINNWQIETGANFTNNGTFTNNGSFSLSSHASTSFNNYGLLKGTGSMSGATISIATNHATGTISPGSSPGCLVPYQ